MDTRAPRHGPLALSLLRALRARSSATWWLATGGALLALASCSSGSSGSFTPSTSPTASGAPSSTPPGSSGGDAGAGADATAGNAPGFDYQVFQTTIEPILDTAGGTGCTDASCHGAPNGQGGFALSRQPAPNSPQMQANFAAVTPLCNSAVPDQSVFYIQATTSHDVGLSVVVSQAQASAILGWIQHASGTPVTPPPSADAGTTTGAGCVAASNFNLGVFTAEIQPILFGTLDYNVSPGQPVSNDGCARSVCHGASTNALYISPSAKPEDNLAAFACFVNLANPSASPVLLCPLADPSCPKAPHPGQNVFSSTLDLNYQRIASYLYATQGAASPLDFAFFAREIDPIFKDPAFGGLGATGQRTCADTSSCHGVNAAGQAPPNLSNFPILADSSSKQGLLADYWSAANFTNFTTPEGSELFLFPTNLIANTTNQPYATGLPHPGGIDFGDNAQDAAQSAQALTILEWAGGLRPDANGFNLNWLVAGTYDADLVSESTTVGDETKLAPTIFDPDGASQFNAGQWDLLASNNEFVDLGAEFPGSPGSGRVAYAVANVINTTGSDIQGASVSVTSPNAVLLYVGAQAVAEGQNDGNNTLNGIATFPAFGTSKSTTRIVVKVLQRAADTQFGFSLSFQTQQNVPLTNSTGELVVRLDPKGGI